MTISGHSLFTLTRQTFALACAMLLSACSTIYEGRYDWRDGWREAEVLEVTTAAQMPRPRFYDCVRSIPREQLSTRQFVVVKYTAMSRTRRRAVPLQANQKFEAGDPVYVQVGDCDTPVVHRNLTKTTQ